jgi:hypothetical protein
MKRRECGRKRSWPNHTHLSAGINNIPKEVSSSSEPPARGWNEAPLESDQTTYHLSQLSPFFGTATLIYPTRRRHVPQVPDMTEVLQEVWSCGQEMRQGTTWNSQILLLQTIPHA